MEEIVFHHALPIQLRFNDVDKFGHVNNTVYFSFYDLGKTEYFASVCPGVDWEKIGIVVDAANRRLDRGNLQIRREGRTQEEKLKEISLPRCRDHSSSVPDFGEPKPER